MKIIAPNLRDIETFLKFNKIEHLKKFTPARHYNFKNTYSQMSGPRLHLKLYLVQILFKIYPNKGNLQDN